MAEKRKLYGMRNDYMSCHEEGLSEAGRSPDDQCGFAEERGSIKKSSGNTLGDG